MGICKAEAEAKADGKQANFGRSESRQNDAEVAHITPRLVMEERVKKEEVKEEEEEDVKEEVEEEEEEDGEGVDEED
jgi:hypothetical protein